MRRIALVCSAAVLAACTPRQEEPPPPEPPAAPTHNLADLAGTWNVVVVVEPNDTVRSTLVATADPMAWVLNLPNRPPMTPRVMVDADSVMLDYGPFESVLRPGVQVSTHQVARLVGGMLVGTIVAHYQTAGADSVAYGRFEGTRTP
ncbi:MAG TPA: hypothetical protein VGA42_06845 [Gemmatimonadales bacterium]